MVTDTLMHFPSLLILALCLIPSLCSANASAVSEERWVAVANSTEWHRLLHYRRSFPFYPLRSELDLSTFFFAPDGYKNPLAELRATANAFQNRFSEKFGTQKDTPNCAFPARFQFLKRALGISFPEPPCKELDAYLMRVNPASMTLVFASAYKGSPGSMFGHTFLRINSKASVGDQKRKDLLDYGLSYAANVPTTESTPASIILGLAGGYLGQFSVDEYYKKVNAYSNGESRDLWEYDLSLTEAETRTVLLHAWEIANNSAFNYFFLDENCAYEILTLLEVARPDWDISQFKIYIIPSETIKRLAHVPGAIKSIRFRPSLQRKMLAKFEALDRAARTQAFQVYDGDLGPDSVSDPRVLEAAAAYLFFREKELGNDFPSSKKGMLEKILLRRSELPSLPADPPEPAPDRFSQPELGHYTYSLGLATGRQERDAGTWTSAFVDLRFKFAYHDLLNSDLGYIPYSHVDFPEFILRQDLTHHELRLEEVHLLSLTSLSPMTFIEKTASWRFKTFSRSPLDQNCVNCKALHLEGGYGAAFQPMGRRWILYSFLNPTLEFSGQFQRSTRFIPYVEAGTLLTPTDPWKIQLAGKVYGDIFQSKRQGHFSEIEFNQGYGLTQWLDIRTFARWIVPGGDPRTSNHEFAINLNGYFQ